MKYKTFVYTRFVIYNPEKLNVNKPDPNSNIYQSEYYQVNSRHHVVDILNNALSECFSGIKTTAEAGGDDLPGGDVAPWLISDYTSGLLVLNCDVTNFSRNLDDPIELWVNEPLFSMLSSFEFIKDVASTDQLQYKLDIHDNHGQNLYEVSDQLSVIQSFQLYPTISQWNPCESIVLVSNTLPLKPTLVPKVNTNITGNVAINDQSENIITDFVVDTLTESLTLSPQYPRYIDLESESRDFKSIDIQVYWKDKIYGSLHPVLLPSYSRSSILLAFTRKAYSV
jgi:hypothetical protein